MTEIRGNSSFFYAVVTKSQGYKQRTLNGMQVASKLQPNVTSRLLTITTLLTFNVCNPH